MLYYLLGTVPDPAVGSAAIGAGFICLCIFASVFVSNRKSSRELELSHNLAVLQANNANRLSTHQSDLSAETDRIKIAAKRDVDLAQVQNDNLLVSHEREPNEPRDQNQG